MVRGAAPLWRPGSYQTSVILGHAELGQQTIVAFCLLNRVQIFPLQVSTSATAAVSASDSAYIAAITERTGGWLRVSARVGGSVSARSVPGASFGMGLV